MVELTECMKSWERGNPASGKYTTTETAGGEQAAIERWVNSVEAEMVGLAASK
jgi:hypothetical protein